MKKHIFIMAACTLCTTAVTAQNYFAPLQLNNVEELLHSNADPLPGAPTAVMQQTPMKPAAEQQRLIGYHSIQTNSANGSVIAQDSSTYVYGGARGTKPSTENYMPVPLSKYDTSLEYDETTDFSSVKYVGTQQFNNADLLTAWNNLNTTTDQDDDWITQEYYPDNTLKQMDNMNYVDEQHNNYVFKRQKFNQNGMQTYDSLMQYLPDYPPTYFYYQAIQYTYDDDNRLTYKDRYVDIISDDISTYDYIINKGYYFYDGASEQYNKDSTYIYVLYNDGDIMEESVVNYYNYDEEGQLVEQISLTYDGTATTGDTTTKILNTYDESGNLNQVLTLIPYGEEWVNSSKVAYEYTSGLINSQATYVWGNEEWELYSRNTYHINSQQLVDTFTVHFSVGYYGSGIAPELVSEGGMLSYKYTFAYNSFKNLDERMFYSYSEQLDENGIVTGSQEGGLIRENCYYTTYDDGSSIPAIEGNNIAVQVYPNPSAGIFTVDIPAEETRNGLQANVYDMTGRLMLQQQILHAKTALNLQAAGKGIYTLRITNNDGSKNYAQSIIISH